MERSHQAYLIRTGLVRKLTEGIHIPVSTDHSLLPFGYSLQIMSYLRKTCLKKKSLRSLRRETQDDRLAFAQRQTLT